MARGGSRPGAGRPKGVPNKRTVALVEAAAAAGELPLDYMLRVMRDGTAETDRRDTMARTAAPYLHSRLQTQTLKGDDSGPVTIQVELVNLD